MGFSENLLKMRKQRGWTQMDLAIKSDINPKTISSYENGRTEPNLGEVVKLCSVFDCSIAYLTGTKEREPGDISVEDIMFKLSTLDNNTLLKISDHIEQLLKDKEVMNRMLEEKAELEKKIKELEYRIKTKESYGIRRDNL